MNPSRRQILASLAVGAVSGRRLSATEAVPPVRAVTRGPKFHWRGYYDKLLFDPTGRFLLANQVDFEGRSPRAEDSIKVGLVDLDDHDRWTELGTTRAWNWQQGCMLQWVPGAASEVFWNDRDGDHFVCHFLDVQTGKRRTIPHPVYCISPDGRWGYSPDFRRLNDCRPGYGYAGLPDPGRDRAAPDDAGVWKVDLRAGTASLLFSFATIAAIPHPGGYSKGAKHWFNHLLASPDGSRFIFLHRWRGEAEGKGFATRMFTVGADGRDPYPLDPHGKTSHFVWRDPGHVIAWAYHPSRGERFYLYRDRSDRVEPVGPDVLTVNGHVTYLPGTGDRWLLNDTYPDAARLQHPHLYEVATGRRVPLGDFRSPPGYAGEWRCDNHPAASRDGRRVAIDSPHAGGRQVYLIDLAGVDLG